MTLSRTAILGAAILGFGMGPVFDAAAQSKLKPAEDSPLNRTKTRIKPASAQKPTKPLQGINPTGRKNMPKQQQLRAPIEGVRKAMFGQNSLQEAIRNNNSGGTIDIPFQDSTAQVSEVFTLDGFPTQREAMRNVIDAAREGRSPANNQELHDIVRGGRVQDLDAARQRYLAQGFQEVRMSNNEVVFVRSDNPCNTDDVVSMVEQRVSEGMYRVWMDDLQRGGERNWCYDDCGRYDSGGTILPGNTTLDTFILRGTLDASLEPSEDEIIESTMTDLELAQRSLEAHDYPLAIERFGAYLKANPEDAPALRARGVAMLHTDQFMQGVDTLAKAYALDPALAAEPMATDIFDDGTNGIYRILQRLVPLAHRSTGHQASVVAAVLMQSQGRTKEAARMLERAKQKGLPEALEREFVLAGVDPARK